MSADLTSDRALITGGLRSIGSNLARPIGPAHLRLNNVIGDNWVIEGGEIDAATATSNTAIKLNRNQRILNSLMGPNSVIDPALPSSHKLTLKEHSEARN